jgi:glutamate dehydrogenase
VARLDFLVSAVDIVRLQKSTALDVIEVGRVYFHAGARFGFDRLRAAARRLKAETPYQKMAVAALVDDFFQLQSEVSSRVVKDGGAVEAWAASRGRTLAPLDAALGDLLATPEPDLAMLTVAARQMRTLLA